MKLLIQRVKRSSVKVEGRSIASIDEGLLVFVGIEKGDSEKECDWLARKLTGLRIFPSSHQVMDQSVLDVKGSVLVVSQFTLAANLRKGNRPDFSNAETPEKAERLVDYFIEQVALQVEDVQSGQFGADMEVELVNDGPVTIILTRPSS